MLLSLFCLFCKNLIGLYQGYLEQAKPGLPKQVSQEPLWAILSMLDPMEREVRMNAEFDRWICNGSIVSMRQF